MAEKNEHERVVAELQKKHGFGKEMRKQFLFDDDWLNLNHGSFGTYPRAVQAELRKLQEASEARPDQFIRYTYPTLLDSSRSALATLLHCPVNTLVFIPNATTGVNTILRNLVFTPGEKILYFSFIYGACENTVTYITETTPAEAIKIHISLPEEDDVIVGKMREAIREERKSGGRVKVAVFDTVVSMPSVRLPFEEMVQVCREEGVWSLVDGAHGVGHVDLDLGKLRPDFFTSNCHKWLHTPRGCAFLYIPTHHHSLIRSTIPTSHGFIPLPSPSITPRNNPLPAPSTPKPPFVTNFEFVGTIDSTPYLCVARALTWRSSIGGESAIRRYCTALAHLAARTTAQHWGTEVLDNSTHTLSKCCMSNVRLPLSYPSIAAVAKAQGVKEEDVGRLVRDWMVAELIRKYGMFIQTVFYEGAWWVRWSAQVYLEGSDFEKGAWALDRVMEGVKKGEFLKVGAKL